jgi:hypothetical protein
MNTLLLYYSFANSLAEIILYQVFLSLFQVLIIINLLL